MRFPRVNEFVKVMLLGMMMFGTQAVWAQQKDSLQTEETKRRKWLMSKPPSGSSEKTQGIIAMILGGSSAIVGVIDLNKKDPCDDFRGPNVFCTSNIDQVHTLGAVELGIGAGAFIFGVIRLSDGINKAKAYEKWKKQGESR